MVASTHNTLGAPAWCNSDLQTSGHDAHIGLCHPICLRVVSTCRRVPDRILFQQVVRVMCSRISAPQSVPNLLILRRSIFESLIASLTVSDLLSVMHATNTILVFLLTLTKKKSHCSTPEAEAPRGLN